MVSIFNIPQGCPNSNKRAVATILLAASALFTLSGCVTTGSLSSFNAAGKPNKAARDLQEEAEGGDIRAQRKLAYMYLDGKEDIYVGDGKFQTARAATNTTMAIHWLRKAAGQGDKNSMLKLGNIYGDGKITPRDDFEAVNWYKKAVNNAEKDFGSASAAALNLGDYYKVGGGGLTQDYFRAMEWYRSAAHWGDKRSQDAFSAILSDLTKAAKQGDAGSQFTLGKIYEDRKFERDQMSTNPRRFFDGDRFYFGLPVDNYNAETTAAYWHGKAALQGHTKAQYALARKYANGNGVEEDQAESMHWYRKAAEQGHAEAQYQLARIFETGRGVTTDSTTATLWYHQAAMQKHSSALSKLEEIGEQGNVAVQHALGTMYENGEGVTENLVTAVRWYRKAAAKGHKEAKAALARIEGGNAAAATTGEN